MHKAKYFLPLLFLLLIGCSSNITEEDLIGGKWVATAGYKEGKPEGEPNCTEFIRGGLEFKQDGVVYGQYPEEEIEYKLEESKEGTEITFTTKHSYYPYYIDKISKDEIGIVYAPESISYHSCYFKRK